MHDSPNIKERLEPLRRFCVPDLYSAPYLSILVQRKRLKAKKIGRNYFTCRIWFEEYLAHYATEEKRAIYYNHLAAQVEKHSVLVEKFKDTPLEKLTLNELDYINKEKAQAKVGFFNLNKLLNIKRAAVITAVFVLLAFGSYFVPRLLDRQGDISGVKDEAVLETSGAASTTMEVINYER
jgi:hypothetical protein